MAREEIDWLSEVRRLRDLIDEAYAQARTEVFDVEGPHADPDLRTPRQQRIVCRLEALEEELHGLREFWPC